MRGTLGTRGAPCRGSAMWTNHPYGIGMRGMRGMSGTGRGAGDANAVGGLSFGIGMRGTIGYREGSQGACFGFGQWTNGKVPT